MKPDWIVGLSNLGSSLPHPRSYHEDPVLTIVVGVTVLTVVGIASGGAF
ncbi:hypothetical protein GS539_01475, partial [Rhodococcus hoagii]|nr:hypothetical protein [Prescottella equi]